MKFTSTEETMLRHHLEFAIAILQSELGPDTYKLTLERFKQSIERSKAQETENTAAFQLAAFGTTNG